MEVDQTIFSFLRNLQVILKFKILYLTFLVVVSNTCENEYRYSTTLFHFLFFFIAIR